MQIGCAASSRKRERPPLSIILNIVAIYDIGMHDGVPFIVSELLEGKTLRERLAAGPLSVREAANFGLQIAEGLIAAHDKHIVHRDLKPENLFITKQNLVKILDFGIAKLSAPSRTAGVRGGQRRFHSRRLLLEFWRPLFWLDAAGWPASGCAREAASRNIIG